MNLLLFKAAGEQCGVELDFVSSLIRAGDVFSPKFLSSIHGSTIRLFGKKMHCFDIVELLGHRRDSIPGTGRLIVVDYKHQSFLLLADSIKETISVSDPDSGFESGSVFSTVSLPHSEIRVINLTSLNDIQVIPETSTVPATQVLHHSV